MDPRICSSSKNVKARPCLSFFKGSFIFHKLFKGKEAVLTDPWNTVSHAFIFYVCSVQPEMESGHYKIKMDNPIFADEETIPMIHQDEDYDD